ncbi:MAG: hypothetical protein LBD75_02160 [Candidatus Peribacteria bacterium]|nr:hypothetical protein [Candidatus Peribacteria bacterium]
MTETSVLPPATTSSPSPQEEVIISETRIVTARYKVYVVILLLLLVRGRMELRPQIHTKYTSAHSVYNQTTAHLQTLKNEKAVAQRDKVYLEEIEATQATLETCLNREDTTACASLPESWNVTYKGKTLKDFSVPLSYLQLNSLYNPKMPIDEKKVLKNLNEYLIREGEMQGVNARNGDIKKITIGDVTPFQESTVLFAVPITLSIEFERINNLISFVHNVEKKLITIPQDRILYKIQEVGYDIVASNEPQTTEISMIAYYYHDPRFQDVVSSNVEPSTPVVSENPTQ